MGMGPRKTLGDHALVIFKAGVAAVPYVGGPLAVLLDEYIPSATERAIQYAIGELERRLRVLEGRIDLASVEEDEFVELFKSTYLLVLRSHDQTKLRAAVSLFTNLLLRKSDPEKLAYAELDHFARCLDLLSNGALRVLDVAGAMYLEAGGGTYRSADHWRPNFSMLHEKMPEYDADLLMGLIAELAALNLLRLPGAPNIETALYGNNPVLMTNLGVRFIRHILSAADAEC